MELKFGLRTLTRVRIGGSNRTFMELKLVVLLSKLRSCVVLIVPLWN